MICSDFFEVDKNWDLIQFFSPSASPIDWLKNIDKFFEQNHFECRKDIPAGCSVGNNVFIASDVKLPQFCVIESNAYIGSGTEIRPFAYIRKDVIIGKNCVIGNSCELKNSILLNNVQVPHFNYVGDSLLGNNTHIGAGVILANLRLDNKSIVLRTKTERINSGLRKIGAIMSDNSEVGCNSVLNPGTILAKNVKIAALQSVKGYIDCL